MSDDLFESDFARHLADVLNTYGIDNMTDTPDFILADHLIRCIMNWQTSKDATLRHMGWPDSTDTKTAA